MRCLSCGHEAPNSKFEYVGAQDLTLIYEGDIWTQQFNCPKCHSTRGYFYTKGPDLNGQRVKNPKPID